MMMSPPSPGRLPQSPRLGHPPPLATPGFFDDPDDDVPDLMDSDDSVADDDMPDLGFVVAQAG